MNYLQLVLLTADFKLNWPEVVLDLFDAQQTVGGVSEQAFSIDCFLAGNKSASNSYYRKMAFVALLPVALVIVAAGFWGVVAAVRRKKELLKRELAATVVILFFMIHPNLVKMLFSMFSCTNIDGKYWLTVDLAIRCWDSTHVANLAIVGVPGIAVWVIGVPTLCLGILIKFRRRHDELWVKLQYGFLINGYRRHQYYWEFVVLYRKIVIICCAVFLGDTIPIQALTVQGVLLLALFLQYDISPYTTPQLNRMELRAIIVADVTIYCGLYYLTDSLSDTGSWFFFTAIVGVNAVFLLYWLKAMCGYVISVAAANVQCIKRRFRPEMMERDAEMEAMVELISMRNSPRPEFAPADVKSVYRDLLQSHLTIPSASIPDPQVYDQLSDRVPTSIESLFESRVKTALAGDSGDYSFSFRQEP